MRVLSLGPTARKHEEKSDRPEGRTLLHLPQEMKDSLVHSASLPPSISLTTIASNLTEEIHYFLPLLSAQHCPERSDDRLDQGLCLHPPNSSVRKAGIIANPLHLCKSMKQKSENVMRRRMKTNKSEIKTCEISPPPLGVVSVIWRRVGAIPLLAGPVRPFSCVLSLRVQST